MVTKVKRETVKIDPSLLKRVNELISDKGKKIKYSTAKQNEEIIKNIPFSFIDLGMVFK